MGWVQLGTHPSPIRLYPIDFGLIGDSDENRDEFCT